MKKYMHKLIALLITSATSVIMFNCLAFADENTCTVSLYDSVNNAYIGSVEVTRGEPMTEPTNYQQHTGYVFDAWYYNPPGIPQNFRAEVSYGVCYGVYDNSVSFFWDAVPNAVWYDMYRATSIYGPYIWFAGGVYHGGGDSGLFPGTTYYYKVKARDNHNIYSGFSSVVTIHAELPSPATISAKTTNYKTVKLSWAASDGAMKYEVYRSANSANSFRLLAITSSTGFIDKSILTGRSYYYKVRPYQVIMKRKFYGAFSPVTSAKTSLGAPAKLTATTTSYNSVRITWGAVPGRTRYEIYRAVESGPFTRIATTSSTSYTNRNLDTGTHYQYKVIAYRMVGGHKVYGGYSPVASVQPRLGSPKTATAKRYSATSIRISWGAVAGRTKYEIWVSGSATCTYALLTTTASTSYLDKGLVTGVPRFYKIIAYRLVNGAPVYGGCSPITSKTP